MNIEFYSERARNPKDDVLALRWLPCGGVAVEAVQIPVPVLMCVLDPDLKAGSSLGNGMHLYSLTVLYIINQVIVCSLICNRNLACSEGKRL
jgi:hypothetical protein